VQQVGKHQDIRRRFLAKQKGAGGIGSRQEQILDQPCERRVDSVPGSERPSATGVVAFSHLPPGGDDGGDRVVLGAAEDGRVAIEYVLDERGPTPRGAADEHQPLAGGPEAGGQQS
jgi:hypothetical protein